MGARVGLRRRLYASDNVAFRDNVVVGAVTAMLTPAFARVGAVSEVSPASSATLFASWERYDFFGVAGFFQSCPSAASNTGPNEIVRRSGLPDGAGSPGVDAVDLGGRLGGGGPALSSRTLRPSGRGVEPRSRRACLGYCTT